MLIQDRTIQRIKEKRTGAYFSEHGSSLDIFKRFQFEFIDVNYTITQTEKKAKQYKQQTSSVLLTGDIKMTI